MDNTNNPIFPLLQLPVNARKNALRNMRIIDIWSLSLSSKATKALAKSINLKPKNCQLKLDQHIDFNLNFRDFTVQLQIYPSQEEQEVHDQNGSYFIVTYTKDLLSETRVFRSSFTTAAKNWFCHFLSVFHISRFDRLEVMKLDHYETMKDILERTAIWNIEVHVTVQANHAREILSQLYHVRSIRLWNDHFESVECTHKCFIRNWLRLHSCFESPLTINDVLITNATYVIGWTIWTLKTLNRWFKLWKSGSNPNLRYFVVATFGADLNVALKGLEAWENSETNCRNFYRVCSSKKGELPVRMEVKGGYEIRRCDGTRATIMFKNVPNQQYFEIFNCQLMLVQFVDFKLNFQNFFVHLQIYPTRGEQEVRDQEDAYVIVTYTRDLDSETRVFRSSLTAAKDWFSHFLSVFHISRFDRLEMVKFAYFESLKESLKRTEIGNIMVFETLQPHHAREVLNQLFHARSVRLWDNPFETIKCTHRFLIQNWLRLHSCFELPLTINDILIANGSCVFAWTYWSLKTLNRWLKLWKSGSNPNLRYFFVGLTGNDLSVVTKGLGSREVPETNCRDFYRMAATRTGDRPMRLTVKGGTEIRRYDGTRATLFVNSANDRTVFELFVWS
ncbi:unnamed protein product [Caenorhabditis brenneri]